MGGMGFEEEEQERAEVAWLLRGGHTIDQVRRAAEYLAAERRAIVSRTKDAGKPVRHPG